MPKWLAFLGFAGLLTIVGLFSLRFVAHPANRPAESFAERGPSQKFEALWRVPEFSTVDHHSTPVTPQTLSGQVWVANFVFTQCKTVCPMLTAKMVQLQRRLAGVELTFISFSVDPEHDSPETLSAYAHQWAPHETRWRLLSSTPPMLKAIADGFHITAKQASAKDLDPILHSSVFVLVDREGLVRGVFDSELRTDFRALEQGARLLAGNARVVAPSEPDDPDSQYHALGCVNCHERPELAPPLVNLSGARREFDTGLVADVDAAYLRESILAPEAKRVRGYPLKMPSYDGLLDDTQLTKMIAWLQQRRAQAPAGPEVTLQVDPVCHMQVRATPEALHAETDGGTSYFCSERCRAQFVANPSAFAP